MIDTNVRVDAHFFRRWMDLSKLKQILSQIGPDDRIMIVPNRVGNLTVVRDGVTLGHIDFNEEDFIPEDEEVEE